MDGMIETVEQQEYKPSIRLEGNQLTRLKINIEKATIGQQVQLCGVATVTNISRYDYGKEGTCDSISFDLDNLKIEETETNGLDKMYQNSPRPSV